MKHSYADKFKERNPIDTVRYIKEFFQLKNFIIKEISFNITEAQTWTGEIQLFYNQNLILTAYGKGMTKQFCQASAYAELYERFCNKIFYIWNPFISKLVMNENIKSLNYYFHPEEQMLTYKDAFSPFQDIFSHLGNEHELQSFFSTITENNFVGIPFQSIFDNNDKIYLDPRLLMRAWGSTGMAAGNTFEEAFNQGFSEVLEHHLQGIYSFVKFNQYYEIDLQCIENQTLLDIIQNIQNADNDIHIIDFSYNLNIPVLMVILINKNTNAITITLGSFPVFDIALERILTEIYQGLHSFSRFKTTGQIPFYSEKVSSLNYAPGGSIVGHCVFPEYILLNTKLVQPNKNVFLFGEYSNLEIFTYYQNLCKQLQHSVYYTITSENKNMVALEIYSPTITVFQNHLICKHITDKTKIFQFLLEYYNMYNIIQQNARIPFTQLERLIKQYINFNSVEIYLVHRLLVNDWLAIYPIRGRHNVFNLLAYCLLDLNDLKVSNLIYEEFYYSNYDKIKNFILLQRYIKCGKYSKEDISKFLNILQLEITEEDFTNYNNKEYILDQIIFQPIYTDIYTSGYQSYIKAISMGNKI